MSDSKNTYAFVCTSELREDLAQYAHEAWSGWMKYMFEKCAKNDDDEIVIPRWAFERWSRQMNTPYADLPESEKESDRDEADKMLEIVCYSDFGR